MKDIVSQYLVLKFWMNLMLSFSYLLIYISIIQHHGQIIRPCNFQCNQVWFYCKILVNNSILLKPVAEDRTCIPWKYWTKIVTKYNDTDKMKITKKWDF